MPKEGLQIWVGRKTGLVTFRMTQGELVQSQVLTPNEAEKLADRIKAAAASARDIKEN